jgi:glucose/arabinose dehydrogenase
MRFRSSAPVFAALAVLVLVGAAAPTVSAAAPATSSSTPAASPAAVDPDLTSFHPLYPARLVDTRAGGQTVDGAFARGMPLGAGETYAFAAAGRGGIPAPANSNGFPNTAPVAVLLNVTALSATQSTHLTVWSTDVGRPTASNVNLAPGQTIANLVLTKVGTNGAVNIFNNSGSTQVIVDVAGWFPTGGSFNAVSPARLLDTRPGQPTVDGQFSGGGAIGSTGTLALPVRNRGGVPNTGVGAVLLNVTAVQASAATHLTVFPSGTVKPNASNVNAGMGETAANLVVVQPGADGKVNLFNNSGSTHVVVDVVGWFPTTSDFHVLDPARLVDTRPGGTTVDGQQAGIGAIPAGGTLKVNVLGRGGVPASGVGSVLFTLTGVAPSTITHLRVYPSGATRPNASNLNLGVGDTRANLAVGRLGDDGTVTLFNNSGSTQVVVDVAGWFPVVPTPPNRLVLTPIVTGLANPWDIGFTPDGTMLFTERPGRIKALVGTTVHQLAAPADIFVSGEAGMEGLAIDPLFATNRTIFTCMASTAGGTPDIRVVRWTVNADYTALTDRTDILVAIPTLNIGSDFHAGCRPRFGPDGFLWVTTGDAGTGVNPQSKTSLAGKVLRMDRNGVGAPGNAGNGFLAQVCTYGHRNPQGIAFRPGSGTPFEDEHGPDQSDEINVLQCGGNYGWDPVPGYNQGVPMTDFNKFPSAIGSQWFTPGYTIAPSGSTFVTGSQWGSWDGAYVMAVLKGSMLRVVTFNADNSMRRDEIAVTTLGRLRIATEGPDGDLFIAQDANPGSIYRVHPAA